MTGAHEAADEEDFSQTQAIYAVMYQAMSSGRAWSRRSTQQRDALRASAFKLARFACGDQHDAHHADELLQIISDGFDRVKPHPVRRFRN
jgi:hypothetical protein